MAGLAIVGVALLAPSAWAQGDRRETETVNKTVSFPDNGTLRLKNFSGEVRISAGSGRDAVIKAVRRGTRDQLDHITLDISTSGDTLTIEANKRDDTWRNRDRGRWRNDEDSDVVQTDFDIQLPASARLDVDVFSSRVDVRGLSGDQRIKTFSGEIVADLTPAGGSPRFDGETFSGDIRVRLAQNVTPAIDFNSFSGNLNTDMPVTMRSSSRRGSRSTATAGSPSGATTLRFHTFSGNVEIQR